LSLVQAADLPLAVRASLSAVNVVVGVLFLVRSGPAGQGGGWDVLRALPSVLASGLAYRLAAPTWPAYAIVLHDAFALIAVVGLATLGRSFSILPARRDIVVRGPYRLVRHPVYLAELGMLVTACGTRGWAFGLMAFVVVSALVVPRVLSEERLLEADEAYGRYRAVVRYRLLPGLF
jgi:protein-S-isoprenylcysteine O-methyltransferase Ste14